jgi:hypothetical protein
MGFAVITLVGAALAAQAAAATFFRLEVGSPIAAGISSKVKDYKKTVLVVRPLVCDDASSVRITGTAEGIVNGQRQSLPLRLIALPTPGVHAVQREWPDGGQWVVHLTGTCPSPKATASTLVPVAGSAFIREKTQVLREPATRAQLEAVLDDLLRTRS